MKKRSPRAGGASWSKRNARPLAALASSLRDDLAGISALRDEAERLLAALERRRH